MSRDLESRLGYRLPKPRRTFPQSIADPDEMLGLVRLPGIRHRQDHFDGSPVQEELR